MTRTHAYFWLTALVWTCFGAAANGDMITYTFSGTITSMQSSTAFSFPGVTVGDPFSITYITDPTTADSNASPTEGRYLNTVLETTINLDGLIITPGVGGNVSVIAGASGLVSYGASSAIFTRSNFGMISTVMLQDVQGNGPNSTDQPTTLDLLQFETRLFRIDVFLSIQGLVMGSISSVTIDTGAVPEPGSLALLFAGGAALVRRRRRAA